DGELREFQNEASIAKFGERAFELSGDWYQYRTPNSLFTDYLLPRVSQPIPTTENVEMAGDPRVQLGDTVEITDPEGLGESAYVQIYGIRRSYSREGGLRDSYTVEQVRPVGVGRWDSGQYGRWDETFKWSD